MQLQTLLSNPNNHQHILKEGALQKMIALLTVNDATAQLRAVACLRGLSTDAQVRLDIVDAGCIRSFACIGKI